MASDAQSLLEKYKPDSLDDEHSKIYGMGKPKWADFDVTKQYGDLLNSLELSAAVGANKASFNADSVKACMAVLNLSEAAPLQYILTVVYDMLREDASTINYFEEALKEHTAICQPMIAILERHSTDKQWTYVADKSAWILTTVFGHCPRHLSEELAKNVLVTILASSCSEQGHVEAITNIMKAEAFRGIVFSHPGVADLIFNMKPKTSSSQIVYKSVFAIWMATFDGSLSGALREKFVVGKLKEVLQNSRTEKVIRLSLTVLKNFLTHKSLHKEICEDIVEEGLLEAVQQLEYEKWRDTELYDDIKEVVQMISSEVKELSNFDRYMKELESGSLSPGFIHSSKFFGENVMKFEQNEFKAVKMLAQLLSHDGNPATLAVACHDIGEFVSLHPLGKKQVARLGIKERIMELMASTDPDKREVRREALLCCQKIMLNKWQDVAMAGEKR